MILLEADYIKLVTETYKKMRSDNKLSTLLARPTRANIRRECLHVFDNRYRREDDNILRGFFGLADSKPAFLTLLERSKAEQFRTLNNYLNEETENTDHANLELLAWLIDFRHRPWSRRMDVILNEEERLILTESVNNPPNNPVTINIEPERIDLEEDKEKPDINVEDVDNTGSKKAEIQSEENEPKTSTGEPENIPGNDPADKSLDEPSPLPLGTVLKNSRWGTGRKRSVAMIALILVLCTSGIFIIWQAMAQQTGCMYWTGDQYVPVSCDEEPNGRVFLPLDVKKMKSFERITRKDTITEQSIGKIYYIKDSNTIEYYTYSGNYPEDLKRYVKKLSRRIFEKDSVNRKLPRP
jgi:hypothetical protein